MEGQDAGYVLVFASFHQVTSMVEESPSTSMTKASDLRRSKPVSFVRRWFLPFLLLIVLVVSFLHEYEGQLKKLKDLDRQFGSAVVQRDMFSMADDIQRRLQACDYKYLVICEPSTRFTRLERDKRPDFFFIGAVKMLLHLPDAAIYLLQNRWHRGTLEFSLAVLFVLVCLSIMRLPLLQDNIGAFILYVPMAPIVTSFIFWLVQQTLSIMSVGVAYFLTCLIVIAGLPTTLAIFIYTKTAHDAKVIVKTARKIGRDVD